MDLFGLNQFCCDVDNVEGSCCESTSPGENIKWTVGNFKVSDLRGLARVLERQGIVSAGEVEYFTQRCCAAADPCGFIRETKA